MRWTFGEGFGIWRVIVSIFRSGSASRFMVEVNIGDLAQGKMTRKKCVLRRIETGDDGTFGVLTTPSGLQIYIAELPWRGNKPGKSCIPAGTYVVEWTSKPKHGE